MISLLSALAGLCGDHDVTLVDENVEEIDWQSLAGYDIVGVTDTIVQKERMRQIPCGCARCRYSSPSAGR